VALVPGKAGDARPFQTGFVNGVKNGQPVRLPVTWLVDTGAQATVLSQATANQLELHQRAGHASSVSGTPLLLKAGAQPEFTVQDQAGNTRAAGSKMVVVIGAAQDILGIDQIGAAGATITWDPSHGTGNLTVP
jgi:aspartyl protease